MAGYRHTQHSPLYWILVIAGAACIAGAVATREDALICAVLLVAAGLELALAFCFRWLAVEDAGEHLLVRFGPLRLFHKRIAYGRMRSVKTARSPIIDGWGIHYGFGRGWIWNLWGRDCVELELERSRFRIGTDDAEGLAAFVRGRIGETGA